MNTQLSQTNSEVARQPHQIRSYSELQDQLHRDLRIQHPEWIDADGNSPVCDWYDLRLAELIQFFQGVAEHKPTVQHV
ncbi:MAG: hypothetical protein ABR611_04155 [Chthoniobacterales bacterium]